MKSLLSCIVFVALLKQDLSTAVSIPLGDNTSTASSNIFIITLDGFRWQEVFNGADPLLINDEKNTPDTATMKMLYWAADTEGRRKKLLPFLWNVVGSKGRIYGSRQYGNKINCSNAWSISYPGYNEIFTGSTDIVIASNQKNRNRNTNVLGWLGSKDAFKGKVASFTSWDVFPYILDKGKTNIVINSGFENIAHPANNTELQINHTQSGIVADKSCTRIDELTFLTAFEFIKKNRPRVLHLGFGETDEAAHTGRYDIYLEKAAEADRMIGRLWHWVQTTPGYRDKTTFIITTDHGRGEKASNWSEHGYFIKGSSQTWLAMIGPQIPADGEIKKAQQLYQKQLAQTIAGLLGEQFITDQPVTRLLSMH